jgi:hypothetical protein
VGYEDQYRFNLHFDGLYVYLPVYSEGKLVSYIGRRAWWFESTAKRYNNATGTRTNQYLFNWEEARHWHRLTLVENTFNAIWLREPCNTVSTFGSTLSEEQAQLIARCPFESVAIIWDEGADRTADKAVQRLRNKYGVAAAFGKITGQPDDFSVSYITEVVSKVHEAAKRGDRWVNMR